MENIILELSKYLILGFFVLFTITGFKAIGKNKGGLFFLQRFFLFIVHFLGCLTLYLQTQEMKYLIFYGVQAVFFLVMIILYDSIYPRMSKLIVNNMLMFLAIGFIMIGRITFSRAVKQFVIVVCSCILALFIPYFIKKMRWLSKTVWLYAIIGIGFLAVMKIAGAITYGASISFSIGGITVQPVEFVKIIFVFFLAAFLSKRHDFKSIMIVAAVSAVHVLLLVWSKELGGAIIFCMVFLSMVYVSTRQPAYFVGGLAVGSGAAVVAYHLFSHVRVRVMTWSTPFSVIKNDTSQISQSLFAIGTGGWFGMGLMEGIPNTIPVASEDFIFSAITEELGMCFTICILLICLSTFIMFINIATRIKEPFYKLLAVGFGIEYIFQVFLTVGGGTKFIPLTGVTLPLISYGGSSVLCTIIVFHIIQAIYVLKQEDVRELSKEAIEDEQELEDDAQLEDSIAYEEDSEDFLYENLEDYNENAEDLSYDEVDYEELDLEDVKELYNQQRRQQNKAFHAYETYTKETPSGRNFDEYAATDEMNLNIPEEFFDE